jgi:Fic family protein
MMLDATQHYAAPLTEVRLFGWHAAMFPTGRSGMAPIVVGGWRTDSGGPMQVVSGPIGRERVHFEVPMARRVPKEMKAFLRAFNEKGSSLDPVLKAAVAHLWFVTIHPFDDGNGRIARAIADLALARAEGSPQRFYSMSSQIQKDRKAYYDISSHPEGTSTSRDGCGGSWSASIAPVAEPRPSSRRFSRRPCSGTPSPGSPSTSGSAEFCAGSSKGSRES